MNSNLIVPFGKYKDQPIANLIADPAYKEWFMCQSELKRKYPAVYHEILFSELPLTFLQAKAANQRYDQEQQLRNEIKALRDKLEKIGNILAEALQNCK